MHRHYSNKSPKLERTCIQNGKTMRTPHHRLFHPTQTSNPLLPLVVATAAVALVVNAFNLSWLGGRIPTDFFDFEYKLRMNQSSE
jgi:hypothetical protein